MDEMEAKLGAIFSNPEMMSQIMSMAQKLGGGDSVPPSPPPSPPPMPTELLPAGLDMATLSKIAGIASSASIDKNQRALLHALGPYLARERISKLEKAMRAAKLAGLATTILGSGILSQTGR